MQVYGSLSSGSWRFSVRGIDAAGNVEATHGSRAWNLSLGTFVQISAPVPPSVQRQACHRPSFTAHVNAESELKQFLR